jgi:hypothetical protein
VLVDDVLAVAQDLGFTDSEPLASLAPRLSFPHGATPVPKDRGALG